VLAGGKDRVNPASTMRQVALRYKGNSDFRLFENRSHWLHGEPGWESLAGTTADWLRSNL
jgi:pimeloyl-ACP methyl ester carboxylesterase